MWSAILGGDREERLRELLRACTRITHTDLRVEAGALAVALAAEFTAKNGTKILAESYERELHTCLENEHEIVVLAARAAESIRDNQKTEDFSTALGCGHGASGFVNHTVLVALHAWLSHSLDMGKALISAICCGGDTDTVGAIVGGIVGTGISTAGTPENSRRRLIERPLSVK